MLLELRLLHSSYNVIRSHKVILLFQVAYDVKIFDRRASMMFFFCINVYNKHIYIYIYIVTKNTLGH